MRKILIIGDSPAQHTGFSNQIRLIANGFINNGSEVVSIGFNAKDQGISMFQPHWKLYGVKGTSEYHEIYHIILVEQPDVIISVAEFSWTMDIAKLPEKWRNRCIHWVAVDCEPINEPAVHSQIWFRKHLVFMADYGKRIYSTYLDKHPNEHTVSTIYLGVDTEVFKPVADKKELKKKGGFEDKFVALFVSRNQWRKRPDLLIRAWAKFVKDKKDAVLIMHTDVSTVSTNLQTGYNLPYLIERFGVKDSCGLSSKLQCSTEELVSLMNMADVHCLPSASEGFGVTLIETMACGVVNITTKSSTMPEIIDNHGVLIDPFAIDIQPDLGVDRPLMDTDKAAEALEVMYQTWKNNVSIEEEKTAMREYIIAKYSAPVIQKQWVDLVENIVCVENEPRGCFIGSTARSILIQGNDSPTFSYGVVCRALAEEFSKRGYVVEHTNFTVDHWNQNKELARTACYNSYAHRNFDYHLRVSYPLDSKLMVGRTNVNLVPYEWQNLPKSWVQESWNPGLHYVMPLSKHEEFVFTGSGVPKEKVKGMGLGYNQSVFNTDATPHDFSDIKKDTFVILMLGSLMSVDSRKGVSYVLDAYTKAFSKSDNVALVIKTLQAPNMPNFVQQVRQHMQGKENYPRITVMDSFMPQEAIAGLYKRANVVVSPNRGEGFNLCALEAMAVGTPAIITAGGGSMDFTSKDTSYLVTCSTVACGAPAYIDAKDTDNGWFNLQPSMDSLVAHMRNSYDDRETLKKKSEAGIKKAQMFTWGAAVRAFELMVGAA